MLRVDRSKLPELIAVLVGAAIGYLTGRAIVPFLWAVLQ